MLLRWQANKTHILWSDVLKVSKGRVAVTIISVLEEQRPPNPLLFK